MNKLLLITGEDIPFPQAGLTIHQPRIREISLIGETEFYSGCSLLNFQKDSLPQKDKINLDTQTNFDILMAIINDNRAEIQGVKAYTILVLTLLFPSYEILFEQQQIKFTHIDTKQESYLNRITFESFQNILREMLMLTDAKDEYNPQGDLSRQIADKLRARKQKLAELKKGKEDNTILDKYLPILSVGLSKSLNELKEYTLYQLLTEFERYTRKVNYDVYISAKMAGATGMEEVKNWMFEEDSSNK